MEIFFNKDKDVPPVLDLAAINASSSEELLLDLREGPENARLALVEDDTAVVTMKPKDNLAAGQELFIGTFTAADRQPGSGKYRIFANYFTVSMVALFVNGKTQADIVLDVQYIPSGGHNITSKPVSLVTNQTVSTPDDASPVLVTNAYDKFVAADQVQALDLTSKLRALANQGVTVGNDEMTVLCPDGVTRRIPLLNPDS